MTGKDIKRVFSRNKKKYVRLFLAVSAVVFFFRLIDPPHHTSNGVFKFSGQGQEQSDLLRSFLQNSKLPSGKDGGVQALFESRTLIRQVAEELGMLLEDPKSVFPVYRALAVKDRIWAECGKKVPERRKFIFSNVHLAEETPLGFFIRLTADDEYEVYDFEKKSLGKANFGVPFESKGNTFTLVKTNGIRKNILYEIKAKPWPVAVKEIKSRLKVKPGKTEKNVFSIVFSDRSPVVAADFINRLMDAYRSTIKKDNEEMALAQMSYLEQRQAELLEKYERALDVHAAFLRHGLKETGFVHLKQEKEFLEKPSEEYLAKLHEVDLKLSRLHKKTPSLGEGYAKTVAFEGENKSEIQGITPETAEWLCAEYGKEKDRLRMEIEQLTRLQKQIFRPDFEISSLGEVLTDSVSKEMLQKAGHIALELQDLDNYGVKDRERMQSSLDVQKRFLSKHLLQLLETKQLQARLLQEKILSLQDTSARLLLAEKELLTAQLSSLQHKMAELPEKWKRESCLTMQKDLNLGMLEGLAQLTESKNVHHRLFYVESKPIDSAFPAVKPVREFIVLQALLAGFILCFFICIKDCMRKLSQGLAVTGDSASGLGIAFCGFFPLFFRGSFKECKARDKEVLRKTAAFVSSQEREKNNVCVAIASPALGFVSSIASLLSLQGLKVLVIECTPSLCLSEKEEGLYEYLSDVGSITVSKADGFDRITAGGYEGHFPELLFRKKFEGLIAEKKEIYDVVFLFLDADPSDAAFLALQQRADVVVIHAEDVLYENVPKQKKAAVVLAL